MSLVQSVDLLRLEDGLWYIRSVRRFSALAPGQASACMPYLSEHLPHRTCWPTSHQRRCPWARQPRTTHGGAGRLGASCWKRGRGQGWGRGWRLERSTLEAERRGSGRAAWGHGGDGVGRNGLGDRAVPRKGRSGYGGTWQWNGMGGTRGAGTGAA